MKKQKVPPPVEGMAVSQVNIPANFLRDTFEPKPSSWLARGKEDINADFKFFWRTVDARRSLFLMEVLRRKKLCVDRIELKNLELTVEDRARWVKKLTAELTSLSKKIREEKENPQMKKPFKKDVNVLRRLIKTLQPEP